VTPPAGPRLPRRRGQPVARPAPPDPRDQEELGAALEETARLGSLVEGLLRLARAEEAGETVAVDLGGLAVVVSLPAAQKSLPQP